jgi:urea transport system substrate-binding protein
LLLATSAVQAQKTAKVGILHSLSGTMAISEVSLKDVVMMAIE